MAFIEDMLPKKYHVLSFAFLGLCLIMMSGFREIGLDPDSENYAASYQNYYHDDTAKAVEGSYILIASILNIFTDDPHALFLFYALFGVALKFIAFYRYDNKRLFLFLVLYLSYFYIVHDMMQIRTGILSAMFLLAMHEITEGRRLLATFYIIVGSIFHISGIALIPLLFLSAKPLNLWRKIFWTVVVLLSLLTSASGGNIVELIADIPYLGEKVALYERVADVGMANSNINGFGVFNLISVVLFLYTMFFSDAITEEDKHFPILAKSTACGLAFYTLLSFIPDLSARISFLYRTATIILLADIVYTIKPKWMAVIVTEMVALFYLNYGLQFIHFALLWKTAGAE